MDSHRSAATFNNCNVGSANVLVSNFLSFITLRNFCRKQSNITFNFFSLQLASSQILSYRVPRNIISSPLLANVGVPTASCDGASFNNINTLTGTTSPILPARNAIGNVLAGNSGNLPTGNIGNFNLAGAPSPYGPYSRNNNLGNGLPFTNGINGIVNSNLGGVSNSLVHGLVGNVANSQNTGSEARFAIGNNGPYSIASGFTGKQPGLQIEANNLKIDGQLLVTGKLPILGTVAVNAQVPTDGTATVNYSCGTNLN